MNLMKTSLSIQMMSQLKGANVVLLSLEKLYIFKEISSVIDIDV